MYVYGQLEAMLYGRFRGNVDQIREVTNARMTKEGLVLSSVERCDLDILTEA